MKKIYYFYSLLITALLCSGSMWGEPLTLKIGTNDSYTTNSPVWGNKANNYVMSQIIYPASSLTALEGKQITKLTFYTRTNYASNVAWANMNVRILERASGTFSSTSDWENISEVAPLYTGELDATGGTMEIELTEPYIYNGGNLVIDIRNSAKTSASSSGKPRFQATSASNSVLYDYNSSSSTPTSWAERVSSRPDVMFTYEDAPAGGCAKPKNLTKSDDTPEGATFTWEQNTDETTYQWSCVASGTEVTSWNTLDANVRTKTITGLTAGTAYDFHVRSDCGAEQSAGVKVSFTPTCPAPTSPVVSGISATGATLSWTAAAGITDYQYCVVSAGSAANWENAILVEGATSAPLSGLTASTNYDVYVRSYYSATTQSSAVKASFQTACGSVTIPFEWDFASMGCWTKDENCHSSTGVSGGAFMFYYKAAPPYQTLISPEFVALSGTVDVTFEYKVHKSSYPETFALGYSMTTSDVASFIWLSDETATNTTYTTYTKTLPAGVKYVAIQCKSNDQYYLYIDNFSIEETPACPAPTITATNVIYNGATINCAGGGSENKWKLQYKADGAPDWTDANSGNLIAAASFDLTGLTPGTMYQAQAQAACEGAWSTAVSFTPDYVTPTNFQVDATSAHTATISWTANSGESSWTVQYKKSGDADWTTVENVSANPYTIEGLTSGSSYQVKVAAGTLYTAAVDFNTECEAKTIPFSADFNDAEANKLPPCWSAAGNTTAVYVAESSSYLTLSSKALYFTGGSGTQAIVILPEINADLNTLQIAFSHVEEDKNKSGQIKFGYYKDATFTELKVCEYSTSSSVWKDEAAFPITGVPAEAKLAFSYTPIQSAYTAALDNISITEYVAPSCAAPTALTVSDITTNSASVSWTSEAAEFALEYKKTSDENWTAAAGTIVSPFVLEGLTANETEYTVRVKAICGENDESEWVELGAPFKTECAVKAVTEETAWTEDFEALTADQAPACWGDVSSYAMSAYTQVNAGAAKDGSLGLQVYVYGTNTEIALLPVFTEEAKNLKLSFDYKNYGTGSNYAALEVGYYAGSTYYPVATLDKTDAFAASGEIVMPNDAPADARIAFRVAGKKSYYNSSAYIDNLTVSRKPACAVPTNLAAVATSTGATLTWTAGDEETQWNVRYSVKDADTWTVLENQTSGFAITGLEVGIAYEVQVQAFCDALHQSAWTASAVFTPVCGAAPTALTVSARTTDMATLTWESTESAFKLQTSLDGETWEEAVDVNAKTFDLTSLTAGTMYYVRVQNACGGEYATTSFTTWCGAKDAAELPLNVTGFTAVPQCWEINFEGEYSGISNNKIFFYGAAGQMAVLPAYAVELNKLSVTFGFSTTNASLEFGYLDEPNGVFHAFASQPTSDAELNLENEAAAVKYIAIRYTGTSAYASGSISSVLVRKTPTCAKPTAVTVTPAVGAASIDWTSEATAWNLRYKAASATEWNEIAVTEKPFELTSLAQGASYKVRVQAVCDEELSDWSEETSFTTNCSGIAEIPYYADFSQPLSACWIVYAQDETYYKPTVNTLSQDLNISGGKTGNSENIVAMPSIAADLTNAVLSFEYRGSKGANYAQLEVGYLTDKADQTSFVSLLTLEQAATYKEARMAMNGMENKYLAFKYAGGSSQGDQYIKNLRVINAYTLADNQNNSATLTALLGQTADITIGRRFVKADYYNTVCLPFDLSAEELAASPIATTDLWAFKYANVDEATGDLLFRIAKAESIEAGVPYFIGLAGEGEIENPLFKDVTIAATTGMKTGDAAVAQLCGIVDQPVVFENGDQTKLFLAANNTLYWWNGTANSQLNNFRAYFKVNTGSGNQAPVYHGMRARLIKEEPTTTTGIVNSQSNDGQSLKVLENNQVIIIRNGNKYTIQGQKIQ